MAKGPKITMETLHSEVTGSSYILNVKRPGNVARKILIDFGGYQENKYNVLNNVLEFDPSEIEAVIVTHTHMDHIYKLPLLYKNGYTGKIYCSKIAAKSIDISLEDSANILKRDFDAKKRHNPKATLLYDISDVSKVLENIVTVNYNENIDLFPGINVTLLSNGHLYGAASILLQVNFKKFDPINILFTSDYYPTNDLFEVEPFPNFVYDLKDLSVVIESTYSTKNQTEVKRTFDRDLIEALENDNFVVIPSIAQERVELILLRLKILQDTNLLDPKIPIYIHSKLGKEYYDEIYRYLGKPFMPKHCQFVTDDYNCETVLGDKRKKKILIASSGMLDQGNIVSYLEKIISDPNVTIILTCYQGVGTRGYQIKNSNLHDKIWVKNIPIERLCTVKYTGEFSKHIKQDESIEFLKKFHDIKNIFITHGEAKKKEIYKSILNDVFPDKKVFIMNRETGFLLSPIYEVSSYQTSLKDVSYYQKVNQNEINIINTKFKKTTKKRHTQKKCYYR